MNGKCNVCGKEGKVTVCCSSYGPVSYAYCDNCLVKGLEPYSSIVSYIASTTDDFPNGVDEGYVNYTRYILKELNISEDTFKQDVKAYYRK